MTTKLDRILSGCGADLLTRTVPDPHASMAAPGRSGAGRGERSNNVLLLLKPTEVSLARVKGGCWPACWDASGPSPEGAKIRFGVLEWSNEMAKARGGLARCSVGSATEDLGLEA